MVNEAGQWGEGRWFQAVISLFMRLADLWWMAFVSLAFFRP